MMNRTRLCSGTIKMQKRILLIALALVMLVACTTTPKGFVDKGNQYADKGKLKEARIMYMRAIKGDPRFGEAYYKLALTNLRLGSYAEALGNLQRAVELQPDNMDAHSRLADIYLAGYAANPAKSKTLLREVRDLAAKIEKRDKDSYWDLRLRAFLMLADEKRPEALELLKQASKKKPGDQGLETTIARTMLAMGKRDEAVQYLGELIEKDKKFLAAFDLLYMIHLVEKNFGEAEKIAVRRRDANADNIQTHLALATHYLGMNEPAKLDTALKGILSRGKDFPDAYQYVGDFFYRVRNLDRAASTYQEGMSKNPEKADGLRKRLIEARVAQGRSQEALDMTEAILKENPKDPEAIAMRASLWLYAGKPEQINTAITELQSVVSKMPENFVLRYNLGRALHSKGDLDGARVQYLDAIKLRSDYLPPRVAMAQLLAERGDFGAAQTAANEILQLDPANVYARLIQSQTFLAQGKYPESQSVLEQVLKFAPDNRDAKYQLGFVYYKQAKFPEAERQFREIYEAKPPDFRGLMGMTESYVSTNRTAEAVELVRKESDRYPKAPALKVAWGNLAVRSKKYDEGVAKYKEVAAADPKNWDIHMRIGEAYRLKGDLNQAIEHWKMASQIVPNEVSPLLMRATAMETVDRRSEAAVIYEQILKLQPDNLVALNNYSFYLADQGTNLDLALTFAQKAKAKAPADPNIADTLGYVYLKKNLPQNAIVIFSDLSGKYPKVSTFHVRLANAYMLKGDTASAKKSLALARQSNPTAQDQQEIQKIASKIG